MDFPTFITAFVMLVGAFFFGYIVGFSNGIEQHKEDEYRKRGPTPYDQGPRHNSPEREHAITQAMGKTVEEQFEEERIDRRATDRKRYESRPLIKPGVPAPPNDA